MRKSAAILLILLACGCASLASAQDFQLDEATPDQIQEDVAQRDATVKVVNMWATWCGPCRVEFPELVRFGRDFADKGVDVIFVSMDSQSQEPSVLRFLQEQGVEGVTYLKAGESQAFVKAFSDEWRGALPSTFVYGPDGEQEEFWKGMVTYEKLEDRVTEILATTQAHSP